VVNAARAQACLRQLEALAFLQEDVVLQGEEGRDGSSSRKCRNMQEWAVDNGVEGRKKIRER
jgi:hypothetical protein